MSDTPQTPADKAPTTSPEAFKAGLPPPPPISEPTTYRPISGFAIAGFAAACVFALMVLVVAAVALLKGEPFFYPVWVLLLPTAGLVISLVARSQIRNSEGTRAGEKLATYGIWISLLTGLGYFVYDRVTGLAVTSQANTFLTDVREDSGFFPHLIKGASDTTELYTAFLLTLPPTQRGTIRPQDHAGIRKMHESSPDGGPGPLASFRSHLVVKMITSAPSGEVKVEPLGVQAWEYSERAYSVRRVYRITTPEAEADFSILVMSNEGETAGEPRRWFVPLRQVGMPKDRHVKLTSLGEGIQVLRQAARINLYGWHEKLNQGQGYPLATIDKTDWNRLPMTEHQRGQLKARMQDLFAEHKTGRLANLQFPAGDPPALGGWKITEDGKLQFESALKMQLPPKEGDMPYTVEGRVLIESKVPIDPRSLPPNLPGIEWEVRAMELMRAAPPPSRPGEMGKGAPAPGIVPPTPVVP
jgi:hypothetical protein